MICEKILMKNISKKQQSIIDIVQDTPVGLTAAELRTRLHVYSFKLAEYELIKELRLLQADNILRLERGRWSVVENVKNIENSSVTTPQKGIQITEKRKSLDSEDTLSNKSDWCPSKSNILNHSR